MGIDAVIKPGPSNNRQNECVKLLAVNPTHAYHIKGLINEKTVDFMLDTVSLLKNDVWREVAGDRALSIWSGHKLVGVEGSPISILSTATIDVILSGVSVRGDFLITDTLNTQAILGLDFLEQHHCIINTEQKTLRLYGKSIRIEQPRVHDKLTDVQMSSVSLDKTFHVPAHSEMELVATVQNGDCLESCCIVEGVQKLSVAVANAIVTPRRYNSELLQVPLLVLNPTSQNVTLHRGAKVAKITTVDSFVIGGVSQQETSIPAQNLEDIAPAKQELLWKLVEKSAANLNNHQQ